MTEIQHGYLLGDNCSAQESQTAWKPAAMTQSCPIQSSLPGVKAPQRSHSSMRGILRPSWHRGER